MKFKLPDGQRLNGKTHKSIVAQMAHEKLRPVRSQASYRKAVARRVEESMGIKLDVSSDKAFVNSLLEHDLMRVDS